MNVLHLHLYAQTSGCPHKESLRSVGRQRERQWRQCQVPAIFKKKKKCLHLPRSGRISNEIFSFSSFLAEYFLAFMCQVNVSYETTHIIINSTLKIHVEFFL